MLEGSFRPRKRVAGHLVEVGTPASSGGMGTSTSSLIQAWLHPASFAEVRENDRFLRLGAEFQEEGALVVEGGDGNTICCAKFPPPWMHRSQSLIT